MKWHFKSSSGLRFSRPRKNVIDPGNRYASYQVNGITTVGLIRSPLRLEIMERAATEQYMLLEIIYITNMYRDRMGQT